MSFKRVELDLNKSGYYNIQGINNNKDDSAYSNGSGKSSLFEALCWVLTGETVRGTKDVSNIFTGDSAEVEIEFSIDKDEFKVIRKKSPSTLYIFVNGEDKSGKGIRDTEKILAQYIPDLNMNFIGSVILLGQGLPQRFTNNTPSGRKEVLENLSKSNFMIEDLKIKVSSRKKDLNESVRKVEDTLLVLNTNKNHKEQELESLNSQFNNLQEEKTLVNSLEELKKIKKEIELGCNSLKKHVGELEDNIETKEDNIRTLESELYKLIEEVNLKYSSDIDAHNSSLLEIQKRIFLLRSEIERIENITDICPTCGQKLQGVEKPDTEPMKIELEGVLKDRETLETIIYELKSKKEFEITEVTNKYVSNIEDNKSELKNIKIECNENRKKLEENNTTLSSVNTEIAVKQKELDTYNAFKENLVKSIEDAKTTIEEINAKILYNENEKEQLEKRISIINKIFSALNKDFRGYLLTNVINYIDKVAKQYCIQVFNNDKLNFTLDGNNISISYCGKDYENLSGGEKQKIDIIVQFSIRDMLSKYLNFSSNILVLDEVTDFLDNQGVESIFNLITNNLKDVPSIYFITHHEDLMFPYDGKITIIKDTDGISSLIMS